eukprot:358130-Chlamydomonas_euryale.AAC.9
MRLGVSCHVCTVRLEVSCHVHTVRLEVWCAVPAAASKHLRACRGGGSSCGINGHRRSCLHGSGRSCGFGPVTCTNVIVPVNRRQPRKWSHTIIVTHARVCILLGMCAM